MRSLRRSPCTLCRAARASWSLRYVTNRSPREGGMSHSPLSSEHGQGYYSGVHAHAHASAATAEGQPSSATDVFARMFKSSPSHLAASRARTAVDRHHAVYQRTLRSSFAQPLSHSGSTEKGTSLVQKVFEEQKKKLQRRTHTSGERANSSAWQGLRRVAGTCLARPQPHSTHPFPPQPPSQRTTSSEVPRQVELYHRAYDRWEQENARVTSVLHASQRLRDTAKQTIRAWQKESHTAFEEQTNRWTMWIAFPLLVLVHTAFFADAAFVGETLDNIAFVDYNQCVREAKAK